MSVDAVAVGLTVAAAPAITLYWILFTFQARPWWRNSVGRAHFGLVGGLAMLIDISIAYHWLGDNYALRDAVRLFVYGWISASCWLTLGAWFYERRKSRQS